MGPWAEASVDYCYCIHNVTAENFGVGEQTLIGMLEGLGTASVDDRMRPLRRYAGKVTRSSARVTPADAEYAALSGTRLADDGYAGLKKLM